MVDTLDVSKLTAYVLGLGILYVLVRTFVAPIRVVTGAAYHLALGGAMLAVANLVGAFVGFHLALNPASALLAGYLGIPGVLLLAAATSFLAV